MKPSDVIVGLIQDIAKARLEKFKNGMSEGAKVFTQMMGSKDADLLEHFKQDPHTQIAAIIAWLDMEKGG